MRPEASEYPAPPPGSDGAVQQLWNNMNEGMSVVLECAEEKQAEPQAQYLSELERYWLEI